MALIWIKASKVFCHTDIDRAVPWRGLQDLTITDAMRPLRPPLTADLRPAATVEA